MNRALYYNYIEEKLSVLVMRIESRGKLNILDFHLHSETFYLDFFNLLFSWKLENLNSIKHNVEGIDLIDKSNFLVVQVSATATKQKIESSLDKNLAAYSTYGFRFISISKSASTLRDKKYKNPHNLTFSPLTDIFDVQMVLKTVQGLSIEPQKKIFDFIKLELGQNSEPLVIESNLAAIVNILSQEDLNLTLDTVKISPYEVEGKIDYNKLDAARSIIDDYKIHYGRLDRIYAEFNKLGANKSTSVLNSIRQIYLVNKNEFSDDHLFLRIIESVAEKIQASSNYSTMPYEELELCVNILVVDAFIRCKIFENPKGLTYAAA